MKLYLVRHGETDANKNNLHNTPGIELNSDGIKQAKTLAKRFKNIDLDFIYSSPLPRALQTSEIISGEINLPIEKWGDIAEVQTASVNWGKPEVDKKAAAIEKKIAENYYKGNWRYLDEETFDEIKSRARKVLDHVLKKHKGQNVLCVSHASFIKMIVLLATIGNGLSPDVYLKFREHWRSYNTGITILEYTNERGWILDTWNDKSHI